MGCRDHFGGLKPPATLGLARMIFPPVSFFHRPQPLFLLTSNPFYSHAVPLPHFGTFLTCRSSVLPIFRSRIPAKNISFHIKVSGEVISKPMGVHCSWDKILGLQGMVFLKERQCPSDQTDLSHVSPGYF